MTSRFHESNGRRILVMKESSDESQGIHTTVMRIVLGLYVHNVNDKFLGCGMVVPGNQINGSLGWLRPQGIVHSYSVRGLVDGRDGDPVVTIDMEYLGILRCWQIKTEVLL